MIDGEYCSHSYGRRGGMDYGPTPSIPVDPTTFSEWYSGNYSGCTLCHYAHVQDKAILTNDELSISDRNFREWFAVGYTPLVLAAGVAGSFALGPDVMYVAGVTCLSNPICTQLIGAGPNQSNYVSRSPQEIGRQGVEQAASELPITPSQRFVEGLSRNRIYDGYFTNSPGSYVEVKTSLRGVVYATEFIRSQIQFDSSQDVTWIFVNARPSVPLIQTLQNFQIPWTSIHVP